MSGAFRIKLELYNKPIDCSLCRKVTEIRFYQNTRLCEACYFIVKESRNGYKENKVVLLDSSGK
jgi:hypothetical protein